MKFIQKESRKLDLEAKREHQRSLTDAPIQSSGGIWALDGLGSVGASC